MWDNWAVQFTENSAHYPVIRSAEDILSERYAKGELTREQYMQMKEDLKKVQ